MGKANIPVDAKRLGGLRIDLVDCGQAVLHILYQGFEFFFRCFKGILVFVEPLSVVIGFQGFEEGEDLFHNGKLRH